MLIYWHCAISPAFTSSQVGMGLGMSQAGLRDQCVCCMVKVLPCPRQLSLWSRLSPLAVTVSSYPKGYCKFSGRRGGRYCAGRMGHDA